MVYFEDMCKSKLGKLMCAFRADRPSEWQMDEFIQSAEEMAERISELERQRDELLAALHDAATSLETIQLRSFGEDSYLDDKHSMRAYAGSRAKSASDAITKAKGVS